MDALPCLLVTWQVQCRLRSLLCHPSQTSGVQSNSKIHLKSRRILIPDMASYKSFKLIFVLINYFLHVNTQGVKSLLDITSKVVEWVRRKSWVNLLLDNSWKNIDVDSCWELPYSLEKAPQLLLNIWCFDEAHKLSNFLYKSIATFFFSTKPNRKNRQEITYNLHCNSFHACRHRLL